MSTNIFDVPRGHRCKRSPERERSRRNFFNEDEVDKRDGGDPRVPSKNPKRSYAQRGRSGKYGTSSGIQKGRKLNSEDLGGDNHSYGRDDLQAGDMGRMVYENHEGATVRFSQKGNNAEAHARETRGSSMETRRGRKKRKNHLENEGSGGRFTSPTT